MAVIIVVTKRQYAMAGFIGWNVNGAFTDIIASFPLADSFFRFKFK